MGIDEELEELEEDDEHPAAPLRRSYTLLPACKYDKVWFMPDSMLCCFLTVVHLPHNKRFARTHIRVDEIGAKEMMALGGLPMPHRDVLRDVLGLGHTSRPFDAAHPPATAVPGPDGQLRVPVK